MKKRVWTAGIISVMVLLCLTACSGWQGDKKATDDMNNKEAMEKDMQAKTEVANTADKFLTLLTELRWEEAANMTENRLKTQMPGINDMEWGLPEHSESIEYENILKSCMRNAAKVEADAESIGVAKDKYIIVCRVEAPSVRTCVETITQNAWKTTADAEANMAALQEMPKETVQVTLVLKEEANGEDAENGGYKVCAASDISGLSTIFQ